MKNTLIFRSGLIGDHLVALPALSFLKKNTTNKLVYISFIEKKNHIIPQDILGNFHIIDVFFKVRTYNLFLFIDLIKLSFFIILNRCEEVYHLQTAEFNYIKKRLFFRLLGIKTFYRIKFSSDKKMSDSLLKFVSNGLIVNKKKIYPLKINDDLTQRLLLKLKSKFNFDIKKNYVAFAICSNMKSKIWDVENYIYIALNLMKNKNIIPCFFGGVSDKKYIEKTIKKIGFGLNFAGELSVFESIIAMDYMSFYVGNDTGVMHMAAVRGKKCFAIFSSMDVKNKWYPFGNIHKIFRTEIDCQGCLLRTCSEKKNLCLRLIEKESVYNEIIYSID